jgi:hypothetical protein
MSRLAGRAGPGLTLSLRRDKRRLDGASLQSEDSIDPQLMRTTEIFAPVQIPSAITQMELTMTTFDKREQGFEAKFAHDEELMFKAAARSNKLLGMWAASQLGLSGDDAAAYATALVTDNLGNQTIVQTLNKVSDDLAAKGISREQVAQKVQECLHQALAQLEAASRQAG